MPIGVRSDTGMEAAWTATKKPSTAPNWKRLSRVLGDFVKKLALKFDSGNIAKTYVALEKDDETRRVRSYISILNSGIRKRIRKR
jgi:hypothetical protein